MYRTRDAEVNQQQGQERCGSPAGCQVCVCSNRAVKHSSCGLLVELVPWICWVFSVLLCASDRAASGSVCCDDHLLQSWWAGQLGPSFCRTFFSFRRKYQGSETLWASMLQVQRSRKGICWRVLCNSTDPLIWHVSGYSQFLFGMVPVPNLCYRQRLELEILLSSLRCDHLLERKV